LAFGSSGVPLTSTYKIALASNRLQKNLYGGGYHEVMDYGAIDALPNPGYGAAAGVQEDDILVQKMADMMQNQFGLKPKMQGPAYTPPFPEWYYRVSYGPPWAHYLGGYQDRLLGGPLGLPVLRYTAPDGVEHKDYGGEVLG
jgi:hypothetical protein